MLEKKRRRGVDEKKVRDQRKFPYIFLPIEKNI